jgi:hypothetical protein
MLSAIGAAIALALFFHPPKTQPGTGGSPLAH